MSVFIAGPPFGWRCGAWLPSDQWPRSGVPPSALPSWRRRSGVPPSALPGISPSRGEIGRRPLAAISADGERQRQRQKRRAKRWRAISPLEGEMSAQPTEGGGPKAHRHGWQRVLTGKLQCSGLPPSALPGISPSRGEIGRRPGSAISADGVAWSRARHGQRSPGRRAKRWRAISPLEGEMSA
ncbi:hypothetical protein DMY87_00885 [Rhizobium wuzhouense]|uniref:Uncharacterized protein n=1 Tax=Rhizobium wuzhouense TaxID=1986026 RepID=A0ABX5P048_9HYPH|nr:hypothetical protein DMY87_00885 [Rhizobium wuzhouense]